ncbi:MAG: ComF family protein [Anaerolineaceae bacterium]
MKIGLSKYLFQDQIYRFFWQAVDFLYPPVCAGCGAPGEIWCQECNSKVHLISDSICQTCGAPQSSKGICPNCKTSPPPFTAIRSWAEFEGPLREALHRLKYKSDLALGYEFSIPLKKIVLALGWDIDVVIPIPISKSHKKTRGYNQSACIARPLAYALHKPILETAVFRTKETKSQVELSREERFKNLQSAFLGISAKLLNMKVLLVDDITTTGATLISCSEALKQAGCSQIYCLTVARTMLSNQ